MSTTPEPTPIFWDSTPEVLYDKDALTRTDLIQMPTVSKYGITYEKEWDGERSLITGFHPATGMPMGLTPLDAPTYPENEKRNNSTAEDLDRKCSEMEETNRYYR
ncbi:hypothetical protein [Arthrobacter sp. 31Y]|uniref:hypothetical protein n=1 Tax=Arthrobacter sp. 31Y TaxID=1115632 RepID=UPI000466B9EF|nr:hypothetical protein [Arthrobacter sp. 31Y]